MMISGFCCLIWLKTFKSLILFGEKTNIDNVRYSFETQEFFQRQIEEAINTLINDRNKESNKAFAWFMGD